MKTHIAIPETPLARQHAEILNGKWKFPEAKPE